MKKFLPYVLGILFVLAFIEGLVYLLAPSLVTTILAGITICLSLALGILIPNVFCFWGLILGICALVFPSGIVGIILVCLGFIGAVANIFISKKI